MVGRTWQRTILAALIIGLVHTFAVPSQSTAEVIVSSTLLDGAQAVPGIGSSAVGAAILALDDTANEFSFDLFVTGIELGDLVGVGPNSSSVHLHKAARGAAGPIIVDVGFLGEFTSLDSGGFRLEVTDLPFGGVQGGLDTDIADNVAALRSGLVYVNIHTNAAGSGEIRGQLSVVPEPSTLVLCGLGLCALIGYGWRKRRS